MRPCAHCGKERKSHRAQCRNCMNTRRRALILCPRCGQEFWPWVNGDHALKFCGCPVARKVKVKRPKPTAICLWCQVVFTVVRSRRQKCCSRTCRNRYQSKARKLRLRGLKPNVVSAKRLHRRDGGICGLCLKPVDPAIRYPHPGAATVDHIVPITRGGTQDDDNLQLAHARCNTSKGNRVGGGGAGLVSPPTFTNTGARGRRISLGSEGPWGAFAIEVCRE